MGRRQVCLGEESGPLRVWPKATQRGGFKSSQGGSPELSECMCVYTDVCVHVCARVRRVTWGPGLWWQRDVKLGALA